jgi:RNA polymerase sigma-70 factor, ECF subfamily
MTTMASMGTDWRELFGRYGSRLLLFARQFAPVLADAEDLVQEAFVRYWSMAQRNGDFTPELMFTLVRRAAIDHARRCERRSRREERTAEWYREEPPLFSVVESRERWSAVEQELTQLPPEQREVLVLKVWGEMTFDEVAKVLEISPNTAASRYRYGIAQLRRRLTTKVL